MKAWKADNHFCVMDIVSICQMWKCWARSGVSVLQFRLFRSFRKRDQKKWRALRA